MNYKKYWQNSELQEISAKLRIIRNANKHSELQEISAKLQIKRNISETTNYKKYLQNSDYKKYQQNSRILRNIWKTQNYKKYQQNSELQELLANCIYVVTFSPLVSEKNAKNSMKTSLGIDEKQ